MLSAVALMFAAVTMQDEDLSDPTSCEFFVSWEALEGRKPTMMMLSQNQKNFDNDDVLLIFSNLDWSISKGDKLGTIKITAPDGSWLSNEGQALDNGFGLWTSYEHIKNIFDSSPRGMLITRAGKRVDNLSLAAMYGEWSDFRRCRDKKVAVKAEADRLKALEKAIPKDPFAK